MACILSDKIMLKSTKSTKNCNILLQISNFFGRVDYVICELSLGGWDKKYSHLGHSPHSIIFRVALSWTGDHVNVRLLIILFYWSPVENRRIYKFRFVRPLVRLSVTAYLKNCSEDFSEIWYEVEDKKYKKNSTDGFLKKNLVFSKTAHLC